MSASTQFPMLKWAQRKDRLFVTIMVIHTAKPLVEIDGKKLKYHGTDGKINYAFEIELFGEIDKEGSKYTLDARNIFLNLHKKESGPYWPRLTSEKVKYHWIEVDWAYFIDEDDEEDSNVPNLDGNDFGDMGGEMDEDDVKEGGEAKEGHDHGEHACDCGHEHAENKAGENVAEAANEEKGEKPAEEKKADLSDLDKEETK